MKIFTEEFKKLLFIRSLNKDEAWHFFYEGCLFVSDDSVVDSKGVKILAVEINKKVREYFASNWQDSDCPQAESTFGICKLAA